MTTDTIRDAAVRRIDRYGYTAQDRANALRGIAENWDASLRSFEASFGRDEIVDGLLLAVSEYADPGLTLTQIREWTGPLVEACRALARFEVGDGWDGDDDDEKAYYSTDTVMGILNDDIDYTLYPLVFGLDEANACRRCQRVMAGVHQWNQRLAGSAFCGAHGGAA